MNAWFCVLTAAITFAGLGLVLLGEREAASTPKADPDLTDYQQKFLDDERGKQ